MARIRTIKPEFFQNEDLAKLSAHARLAFIGLWNHADRDGRLEDRPERLKAVIFPYEAVSFHGFLDELASAKFIIRYEVDGVKYIEIPTFCIHQRPHPKEPNSSIPCREKKRRNNDKPRKETANPPLREGVSLTGRSLFNGKGMEDKNPKSLSGASPDPRVKEFIDWFYQEFLTRTGSVYHVSGGKDGALVKGLLGSLGIDELKRRTVAMFESTDPFFSRASRTIGVLASQINKVGVKAADPGAERMRELADAAQAAFEGRGSFL